jgi:hypothetical protein
MEQNINPIEDIVDKEDEKRIFSELAKIDGLHEYLRALMARDMRFHFNCKKEEQDLTRGAFYRTEWLSKKIKGENLTIK